MCFALFHHLLWYFFLFFVFVRIRFDFFVFRLANTKCDLIEQLVAAVDSLDLTCLVAYVVVNLKTVI